MKITVCIGSSCHLKGSRQIVEELQRLVAEHQLGGQVELAGQFCMGNCQNGVCVTVACPWNATFRMSCRSIAAAIETPFAFKSEKMGGLGGENPKGLSPPIH